METGPSNVRSERLASAAAEPLPGDVEPGAPSIGATIEGINFDEDGALNGFLHIPPDPHGAVGPNHVVSVVNTSIEWHTKAGVQQNSQRLGRNSGGVTAGSFFAPLNPVNGTFDPKVIYDYQANRFVVVTLERQDTARSDPVNSSRILVAVSDDSDPNGIWTYLAINSLTNVGGVDHWADYPGLAVDEEAIYITSNLFTFGASGNFNGVRLWIVNKNPFYAGGAGTFSVQNPYAAAGSATTTHPAQIIGTPPTGSTGTFLVSYGGLSDGTNEFIQVVRVDNPLTAPAFSQQFVNVGDIENTAAAYPDAPQSGTATRINTNDRRAQNAVWRNNRLYTCATTIPGTGADAGQVTARYWDLNTTTLGAIALAQSAAIGGEQIAAGTFTFFPSVAVNSQGDVCLGFAASAPTIFPGAFAAVHLAGDAAGTTRAPLTVAPGLDFYFRVFGGTRNRWGDYSGVSVDPADGLRFWAFNQYALTRGSANGSEDGRWGTRWGLVTLDNAPPLVTLTAGAISFLENGPPIAVDPGATVTDPDSPDFNGGSLTVDFLANGAAEDRLLIRNEGTGTGQIGISGNLVTIGGLTIGSFTGGTNGTTPLVVSFTSVAATPLAIQALIRNITYQNVSDNPSVASRSVRFVVNDGDGASSVAATRIIAIIAINDSPTLAVIPDPVAIPRGSGTQTINLAGISAGGGESQTLTVTATSSNPGLIPNPTVTYTSPNTTGSISFTPVSNISGTAIITVIVQDNGGTSNGGVNTVQRTFTVTVIEVNNAPTLAAIGDPAPILEDAGAQTINLSGISAGAGESQTLTITAVSSNTAVIPNPTVTYTNPSTTGSLTFTPVPNANGSAVITVTVQDNGGTANGGVNTTTRTFTVTVTAVNDAPTFTKGPDQSVVEDSGPVTVTNWETNIVPGPANESAQTVSFTSSSTNPTLFAVAPIISPTGTLTFTPAANAFGTAVVTVTATDTGGTANGGVATSVQTFNINISPVNDAPSFTKGADQTVIEDSGAISVPNWATAISAGPNEGAQGLTFTATAAVPTLFAVQPAISANGTLSFTPAANASGTTSVNVTLRDDGGTLNGGQDGSAVQTFNITITSVNDAPTVTVGPNQTTLEDSGTIAVANFATAIAAGPANENTQTVTLSASNNNAALFSVAPTIAANGTLTYTPAANAFGTATVTVTATDDGGTANGGVNSSSQAFTITVNGVNDAPSFTKGPDQTVLEDSGPRTVTGWATAINPGPANESAQTVTFTATPVDASLFSAGPAVAPDGTLTFTPAPDAFGSTTVNVQLTDNGGTVNGGVNVSGVVSFQITITPANDSPSFAAGANQSVNEDAALQTVPGWAINLRAGPANENGQALTFAASNSNAALFAVQPSVAADGTLTYRPAPNAVGAAIVSVVLSDNGGTANGGASSSAAQTFDVIVTAVNDPPVFTKGPDQVVVEDSGQHIVANWGTAITPGPADENAQTVQVSSSSDNNALFAVPPLVSADGTLTFEVAPNAVGSANVTLVIKDSGGTANGGNDTVIVAFRVTVAGVNDAPSFLKGPNQIVLEDSGAQSLAGWATAISAGPPDESSQGVTFVTEVDKPELFAVQPAVSTDGALTFTPAANAVGTAQVIVRLRDSGGTDAAGVDTSATQMFAVEVSAVNDPPTFAPGGDVSVDVRGIEIAVPWATAISAGPPDEAGQTLTFIVTTENPALFLQVPTLDAATGVLKFTPLPDADGSTVVSVRLKDDGGTANAGSDTSGAATFTLNLRMINDAPVFIIGPDLRVARDAGPQTLPGWATGISPGSANERAQMLTFIVETDQPSLFSAAPVISPDGTLTYTPSATGSGRATIRVRLHDSGGTANGGIDTSAPQTFEIVVTSLTEELGGSYVALAQPAAAGPTENARVGYLQLKMSRKGTFTAKVTLGGTRYRLRGSFGEDGIARFGRGKALTQTLVRRGQTSLILQLAVDVADGTDTIMGTITDGGNGFSVITGDRVAYGSRRKPAPPLQHVPADLLGSYTVVFPALTPAELGLPASAFPQGDGFGRVAVSRRGSGSVKAILADGSRVSSSSPIAKTGRWIVFRAIGKRGSISGFASFREGAGMTDLDGDNLLWIKAAGSSGAYPRGWPAGIAVDLAGSRYDAPSRARGGEVLPGLGPPDADGNAILQFTDGGFPAPGLLQPVAIDAKNKVSLISPVLADLKLKLAPKTGFFSGTFADPSSGRKVKFGGAVLQKQRLGSGFFLHSLGSGSVTLTPVGLALGAR